MSRAFPVKGLADLDRYLSALPKNMQRNAYSAGLRAAAAVIRDEAKLRAPKGSGKLARSIKSSSVHLNAGGRMSIRVGPRGKKKADNAYLGYFHEYGVAPHLIARHVAKRGRAGLKAAVAEKGSNIGGVLKIGERYVSGAITHPGFAAQPFLRPALDIKADEAMKAMAASIRAYLEGKTGFAAPADLDEAA